MSVMLINRDTFLRVGKYLTITMEEEKAKELVSRFSKFNIKTYEKRYGERVSESEYISPESIKFYTVPLASGIQLDSDFGAIMYNCSDYAEDIDINAWRMLESFRNALQKTDFYKVSKAYDEYTTYG